MPQMPKREILEQTGQLDPYQSARVPNKRGRSGEELEELSHLEKMIIRSSMSSL